jgi:hypothetical protein
MKNFILGILCIASFVLVVGSIGAWDNGVIGFGQFLIQAVIGIGTAWISLKNIKM